MYCNKCGDIIEPNEKYCNKCGNLLQSENNINQNFEDDPYDIFKGDDSNKTFNNHSHHKSNKKLYIIAGSSFLTFISLIVIFISSLPENIYFNDTNNVVDKQEVSNLPKKNIYRTSVNYDNTYSNVEISTLDDAIDLIIEDSSKEKKKCSNSKIAAIENSIINNYGITAVNLCELDINFAKEIENVVKNIYNNYPTSRGYLTNLTLSNTKISQDYIAVFIGYFPFASSNTPSEYPLVFKTLVGLNSSYFLNVSKLEATVADAAKVGHFPKNSTRYSPVAHEFGHYLSFLSTLSTYNIDRVTLVNEENNKDYYNLSVDWCYGEHSKKLIETAYNNYMEKYDKSITELQFRQSISNYAVAKDNEGNYIYDETIAEAFHDYYLNGDKAAKASIEIVAVLKQNLEGLR